MHNQLETLGATVYNMQNKVITGEGGFQEIKNKPLMDHGVASNLDRLTNEASDFHMWNLRLKNALHQIDINYKTAITMIERATDSILTYDGWYRKYDLMKPAEQIDSCEPLGLRQRIQIALDVWKRIT